MGNNKSNTKKEAASRAAAEESRRLAQQAAQARMQLRLERKRGIGMAVGILITAFLILLFFSYITKWLVLLTCAATVVVLALRYTRRLSDRLAIPAVAAMAAYVLVCGLSAVYALSGKFFIQEYHKLLVCFFIYILIVTLPDDKKKAVRAVAVLLAGAGAVFAFMSVEAAAAGVSAALLKSILNWSGLRVGFEAGTRLIGIFGNPNVLASLLAVAIYLALFLLETHEKPWQRVTSSIMLSFCAFAFLLAFSMGGTAIFLLGLVFYLVFGPRGRRILSFLRMAEVVIPTLIFAFVAFSAYNRGGGPLPIIAMLLNALAVYLLDRFVYERLAGRLENNTRLSTIVFCAVAGVLVLYMALGLTVSGPWTSDGSVLSRSAYPQTGENALHVEADGPVQVTVASQNREQTMTHTRTTLYQGPWEKAAFTVPEGSLVLHATFECAPGTTLYSASLASGETFRLDYKLLPGFIANRLQGLRANQNAIQRTVFFEDGMKLFRQNPIRGNGMGSFESAVPSVQSFYYQTKYVHNHYIQVLVETGIIGIILYGLMLLLSLLALIRSRREDREAVPGIYPALWAGFVMVCGHSAVEVNLSNAPSMVYGYAVFALIALCFGRPVGKKAMSLAVRGISMAVAGVFTVLIALNIIANATVLNAVSTTPTNFFSAAERAAKIDPFDYNDHKLSYVVNAMQIDSQAFYARADVYADDLARSKSNSTATHLLNYFLLRGSYDKAAAFLADNLLYNRANPNAWNECFGVIVSAYVRNPSLFAGEGAALIGGIEKSLQILADFNETALSPIVLDEASQALANILAEMP